MYGKLLGAIIAGCAGMLLNAPPFAIVLLIVVGIALGHFVVDQGPGIPKVLMPKSIEELIDEPPSRPRPQRRPSIPELLVASQEQIILARTLCPLFVEVARADMPMSQLEVRVVREFFQDSMAFDAAGSEEVRLALKSSLGKPVQDVPELVKIARAEVKPSIRLEVVRALYDLAMCDGDLSMSETNVLRQIVQHFNLSDEQLREITKLFFGSGKQHYETLGLTPQATDDDIRSAFRKLATENHPDRDSSTQAAERFRTVKDAYDELKKIRGL